MFNQIWKHERKSTFKILSATARRRLFININLISSLPNGSSRHHQHQKGIAICSQWNVCLPTTTKTTLKHISKYCTLNPLNILHLQSSPLSCKCFERLQIGTSAIKRSTQALSCWSLSRNPYLLYRAFLRAHPRLGPLREGRSPFFSGSSQSVRWYCSKGR